MRKCPFCGKEWEHAGAYNFHVRACELKYLRNNNKTIVEEKKPHEVKTEEEHTCSYRFLNPNNPAERRALQSNYNEVCDVCQNVR